MVEQGVRLIYKLKSLQLDIWEWTVHCSQLEKVFVFKLFTNRIYKNCVSGYGKRIVMCLIHYFALESIVYKDCLGAIFSFPLFVLYSFIQFGCDLLRGSVRLFICFRKRIFVCSCIKLSYKLVTEQSGKMNQVKDFLFRGIYLGI